MRKHIIAVYSKETNNFIGYVNAKLAFCRCAKDAAEFDAEKTSTIIKALVAYYIVDVF